MSIAPFGQLFCFSLCVCRSFLWSASPCDALCTSLWRGVFADRCERMATIPSAQSASSLEEATSVASASAGGAGGSSSSRPHTLPILETTPDSPQPARSTTTTMSDSEQPSPVGRSPTSDGSDPDNEGLVGTTPTYSLLQLSSPTASRRISSGSTLKHIGNIAIQLAAAPSLGK